MNDKLQALAGRSGPGDLQKQILDRDLCSLCGACGAHCPYLQASRHRAVFVDPCGRESGSCYAVCPSASVLELGTAGDLEAPLGEVREALWARAADATLRERGQYGATVSALLVHLLETGAATAAVVAAPPDSTTFPLLPTARLARSRNEVLAGTRTRYVPRPGVALANAVLDHDDESLAFVGRPCEVRGLTNRLALRPPERGRVALRIGLFCMWALDHDRFADYLAGRVDLETIRGMDIDPDGLILTLAGGEVRRFPVDEIRPLARAACRVCPDFSAEAADLSVGGTECEAEWNSLLVRTEAGASAVAAAVAAGALETRPFPADRWSLLLEAARGNKRRAREALDALA